MNTYFSFSSTVSIGSFLLGYGAGVRSIARDIAKRYPDIALLLLHKREMESKKK